MAFSIDALSKPIASCNTSVGILHIYSPSDALRKRHRALKDGPLQQRLKAVLPGMVSKVSRSKFGESIEELPEDIFLRLTDADLSAIAVAYLENREKLRVVDDGWPSVVIEPKQEQETEAIFFDRILDQVFTDEEQRTRKFWDEMIATSRGPASKILEGLTASSANLGRTLERFEPISASPASAFRNYGGELIGELVEQKGLSQRTAEVTKESASLLKSLVDAAGVFLVRFDERDRVTDRQIRWQMWIAVGSLVLATLFSGASLFYAVKTYNHDLLQSAADAAEVVESAERERKLQELLSEQGVLMKSLQVQNGYLNSKLAELQAIPSKKSSH